MRYLPLFLFAYVLHASGCECKQTASKERNTVTIILTSEEHWTHHEGDVILRADEAGRLINILDHYPNTEDLIPDFAETESNKGSPCVVHLTLDDEATTRVKSLEKAISLIKAAADPRRETTIYVHLTGISP